MRLRRGENGGVDRGGERHFLWLQAQLVSTLDRCGCQIFIPTLETAGGVNAAPASVILPHKTQPCVCARSSPTVTTSRYHIDTHSASSCSYLYNPDSKIDATLSEMSIKTECNDLQITSATTTQQQQHKDKTFNAQTDKLYYFFVNI